eukprot:Phypoly_transcript_17421.p1 GENE.Phypoly_transcript_17421~~Phypoly_transcript_17421.p1  ORF type:complete len:197 (+),score=23.10 Phypoly_transcript_17421:191-781(+)
MAGTPEEIQQREEAWNSFFDKYQSLMPHCKVCKELNSTPQALAHIGDKLYDTLTKHLPGVDPIELGNLVEALLKFQVPSPSPPSSSKSVLDNTVIYTIQEAAAGRVRISTIIYNYYPNDEATTMLAKLNDDDFIYINKANHDQSVVSTTVQVLKAKHCKCCTCLCKIRYKKERRAKQINALIQHKDNWPEVPIRIC